MATTIRGQLRIGRLRSMLGDALAARSASSPHGRPPTSSAAQWDRFGRIAWKNPARPRGRMVVAAAIGAVEMSPFASCGEDRGRKRDELRQFPQILGCGRQEELVF